MGVTKTQRHSVVALKSAYETILMAPAETSRAAAEARNSPAIDNLQWFLARKNPTYTNLDEHLILDHELNPVIDPSSKPPKGCTTEYIRYLTLRYLVQQIPFRILTLLLIVVDIALIVAGTVIEWQPKRCLESIDTSRIINFVDLGISLYFVLEISTRIFALRPKIFFSRKSWFNVLDFCIVFVTFALGVALIVIVGGYDDYDVCHKTWGTVRILVVLRVFRFFRLIRMLRLFTEHYQLKKAFRQKVSQNKRRYQMHGVDLDLTYVTDQIIAMSFPSQGTLSWYRNSIKEVAAFLKDKYGDRYKVYNLCSERVYDGDRFGGRVARWPVDDHNVPSVNEMISFVDEVKAWLAESEGHVIAVHCKGGKGRTGTMICILLVEMGLFKTATESLDYFAQRRTDTSISDRFQGVETASQIRYVKYFEQIFLMPDLKYPKQTWMTLEEIVIYGISSVGKGDASDLSVEVSLGRDNVVHEADLSDSNYRTVMPEDDAVKIRLSGVPKLCDDVRVKFTSRSSRVPKGYERCAFYFWFHTFFVSDPVPDGVVKDSDPALRQLFLRREEIDNPHKMKTWKVYQEDFAVKLLLKLA